mmetsp:Transcript_20404/g.43766  ORF Transcript_20404/g.43766 Transcript_20404/m.43766 type:complete len:207 (-) Transcript_20404:642-1262(-)
MFIPSHSSNCFFVSPCASGRYLPTPRVKWAHGQMSALGLTQSARQQGCGSRPVRRLATMLRKRGRPLLACPLDFEPNTHPRYTTSTRKARALGRTRGHMAHMATPNARAAASHAPRPRAATSYAPPGPIRRAHRLLTWQTQPQREPSPRARRPRHRPPQPARHARPHRTGWLRARMAWTAWGARKVILRHALRAACVQKLRLRHAQ